MVMMSLNDAILVNFGKGLLACDYTSGKKVKFFEPLIA